MAPKRPEKSQVIIAATSTAQIHGAHRLNYLNAPDVRQGQRYLYNLRLRKVGVSENAHR